MKGPLSITLITGDRDVGKTRYLATLVQSLPHVGGVLCEKWFEGPDIEGTGLEELAFKGYRLRCLQTGALKPFLHWCPEGREALSEAVASTSMVSKSMATEWIGNFRVDPEGLSFGKACVLSALDSDCQQVVLDEVGMAELSGRLFSELLSPILAWASVRGHDLRQADLVVQAYLVVQAQALPGLLAQYPALRAGRVIEVTKEGACGG